ncbi:MAG: Ig-like domain-containing protein [Syntrophobacteraceae bacterium]
MTITCTAPDTTGPSPVSAATNTGGTTVTITFNEDVEYSWAETSDFTVRSNGTPVTLTGVTYSGSTTILTPQSPLVSGNTITVSYNNSSDALVDSSYNATDSFTNFAVTNNVTFTNTAPTFVGSTTTLGVSQNASATDTKGLLHVSDTNSSQTETWSQNSAPSHGSLSFSSATASSGSSDITPGGTITYTPTAGYAGTDSFIVQVSDGTATATRTITVSVTPLAPGTPDLASGSDTGSSSTDNITNATTVSFTGTNPTGDGTSTVRVFLDKNGNGNYDSGTDPSATATAGAGGSWSASGMDISGVTDGTYNVYAFTTSATGSLTSSKSGALSVVTDRAAPSVSSIVRVDSSPTKASSVQYTVTFSESVTGVDATDFALTTSSTATGSISGISGSRGLPTL